MRKKYTFRPKVETSLYISLPPWKTWYLDLRCRSFLSTPPLFESFSGKNDARTSPSFSSRRISKEYRYCFLSQKNIMGKTRRKVRSEIIAEASTKQNNRLIEIAYYQAGKIVVQTLLPEQSPVTLITLNTFGITLSTSADTYIPLESFSKTQSCLFLESQLISLYGGKAASLLIEYQHKKKLVHGESESTPPRLKFPVVATRCPYPSATQAQGGIGVPSDKEASPRGLNKKYARTASSFSLQERPKRYRGIKSLSIKKICTVFSFRGKGNNVFQSTIGNIEIQIAGRLATIMVNYWNFYSFSTNVKSRDHLCGLACFVREKSLLPCPKEPLRYFPEEERGACEAGIPSSSASPTDFCHPVTRRVKGDSERSKDRRSVTNKNNKSINSFTPQGSDKFSKKFSVTKNLVLTEKRDRNRMLSFLSYQVEKKRKIVDEVDRNIDTKDLTSKIANKKRSVLNINKKKTSESVYNPKLPTNLLSFFLENLSTLLIYPQKNILYQSLLNTCFPFFFWKTNRNFFRSSLKESPRFATKISLNKGYSVPLLSHQSTLLLVDPREVKRKGEKSQEINRSIKKVFNNPRGLFLRYARKHGYIRERYKNKTLTKQKANEHFTEFLKLISQPIPKFSQSFIKFPLVTFSHPTYVVRDRNTHAGLFKKITSLMWKKPIIFLNFSRTNKVLEQKIFLYRKITYNNQKLLASFMLSPLLSNGNKFKISLTKDKMVTKMVSNQLTRMCNPIGLRKSSYLEFYFRSRIISLSEKGSFYPFFDLLSIPFSPFSIVATSCPDQLCKPYFLLTGDTEGVLKASPIEINGKACVAAGYVKRTLQKGGWRKGDWVKVFTYTKNQIVTQPSVAIRHGMGLLPIPSSFASPTGERARRESADSSWVTKIMDEKDNTSLLTFLLDKQGIFFEKKGIPLQGKAQCERVFCTQKKLNISSLLLLEKQIFPINCDNSSMVEKEFLYYFLVNNCFAKAFQLVNQNRQLLDFFVDYLLRFQILRQHQILYLFSSVLLNCQPSFKNSLI